MNRRATKKQDTTTPMGEDEFWYKDAIVYQLHVKAFYDSDGSGMGDFRGLTQRLDYIRDLGVNTVWLLPFYPSPLRDDGYDIADYFNVHPDYGSMRDFRAFVHAAHARGLRVVTELVINHTSDQHPWFQEARRAPAGSAKRGFYVWSDTDKKYAGTRVIFTDTETSNWAWDPVAQQYYWHRFFSHQPDLNFDNPHVIKAVTRAMNFWLDAGVDGLRLDAIPYLCEREGTNNENLPETHLVLKKLRAAMDARYRDRMFLAEANQWPEDVRPYFGDGDECHVAFHFPLMPRIFMAVAQEDRHPIVEIMEQTPDIPDNCQWAIFLRNHDELTLEMVTDRERDYMYQAYAHDPRMRVNVGIRRRLASLMDNDMDRIRLLNNLLLSMPGSPVLYYGDEIGMGDNVFIGDRNGVRTPMQWSPDRNAGFSTADPARLYLPPIMDPVYGYQAVNVESQSRDPSSLLNWMKRLIAVRKAHRAFGRGTLKFLRPGNRKVLAYLREHDGDSILCVTNLSRAAQPVELDLGAYKGCVPVEMMGRTSFPPIGELPYLLTLPGYGFYWFRLDPNADPPRWHEERLAAFELPLLVMFAGWRTLFPDEIARIDPTQRPMAERIRAQLAREVWPHYLPVQRWFAAKGEQVAEVAFRAHTEWHEVNADWLFAILSVQTAAGTTQDYFLPLVLCYEGPGEEPVRAVLHRALARMRRGPRVGLLLDAFADDDFCRALVRAMGRHHELGFDGGRLRFVPTASYASLVGEDLESLPVRGLGLEQSNTSTILGDRLVLKAYRRLHGGINPELEMGRFLTETAPYVHIARVAGYLEFVTSDEQVTTLALLEEFVANQGDGWTYTLDYLEQLLAGNPAEERESPDIQASARQAIYQTMLRQLGMRTGEMHRALGQPSDDPGFDPKEVDEAELKQWTDSVRGEAAATLNMLAERRAGLAADLQDDIDRLLARRADLVAGIDALLPAGLRVHKTRYHGDYHLGQVLVMENDVLIIDFEGEPERSLAERRRKHSPLRDVAGMLRSFNYAGYSTLRRLTAERPEDYRRLQPFVQAWERETADTFLQAYIQGLDAGEGGRERLPDLERGRGLLELFMREKALYELRYEINNRPDWVAIPLRGILELLHETGENDPGGGKAME